VRPTSVRRVAVLAGLGGLLFGYDTGVIGGAQLFIEKDFHLSSFSDEVLVSCVLVGAIVGSLLAGALLSRIGRRPTIMLAGGLFVLGSLGAAVSPNAGALDAARIVVGVAIGLVSVAAPLYVAEMSPPARRGALVAIYQLAITIGIFAAYLVDEAFAHDEAWRIMFAIGILPAALLIAGMWTLPESPRWLVDRGRRDDAREVLDALEAVTDTDGELAAIDEARAESASASWSAVLTRSVRPALTIAVALALIQQLTGINTVIYYAPQIFRDAGLGSDSAAIWASVTVSIVNVAATFIAIRFVDRVGRRPLLVIGIIGMVASLAVLAVTFAVSGDSSSFSATSVITIAALWVYVAFFAFSLGPIVWVVIAEIFPVSARGPGNAVATTVNWVGNLVVSLTFLSLIDLLGDSGTFALYAVIGLASIAFVRSRVPETKGRTLEEIQETIAA
jgi:SP family galactose:H+ symporter-like MFS transporter